MSSFFSLGAERWLYYTVEQERDQYKAALIAILEKQCTCVWDEWRTDCECGADVAPRQIARRALTDRPAGKGTYPELAR
jgi:hypothetical protein